MRRTCNRKKPSRALDRVGATVVEFAFVAPILFLFLFGMIEWGRMVMVKQSLTNAARDGCRTACLGTTISHQLVVDNIRNTLRPVIPDSLDASKVRVNLLPTSLVGISPGTPITVDIDVDMHQMSWLPGNMLGLVGNPVIRAHAKEMRE